MNHPIAGHMQRSYICDVDEVFFYERGTNFDITCLWKPSFNNISDMPEKRLGINMENHVK